MQAMRAHRSGRLAEARSLCHKILARAGCPTQGNFAPGPRRIEQAYGQSRGAVGARSRAMSRQNLPEHLPRHGSLGHLERDMAVVLKNSVEIVCLA